MKLNFTDENGNLKPLVLIIDDEQIICTVAEAILGELYRVSTSLFGEEGIRKAKEQQPSLILLDINMMGMNGFEVLHRLKEDSDTADIPVVIMTGDENRETEIKGFHNGVADFVRKPFVAEVLLQRVKRIIELSHLQKHLQEEVIRHSGRAERLTQQVMMALSMAVDAKDHYTNGHSRRVAKYAVEIAKRMGKSHQELDDIYAIGLLHDVGKIGVSEAIINKPGRLTDEEFKEIKNHTIIGYEILKTITEVPEFATGARWHHERFDGRGYPDGLSGSDIPEKARIICVADCYDAMTSKRSYSSIRPQADVRAEIERCKGSQFDPDIADIMIQMIDEDVNYDMSEK